MRSCWLMRMGGFRLRQAGRSGSASVLSPPHRFQGGEAQHGISRHLGAVDPLVRGLAEGLHLPDAQAGLQVTVQHLDLPAVQVGLDQLGRGRRKIRVSR